MNLEFGFHNTETRFHQVIYTVTQKNQAPNLLFFIFLSAMTDAVLKERGIEQGIQSDEVSEKPLTVAFIDRPNHLVFSPCRSSTRL